MSSHFAKINESNIVEDIIVIPESESPRGQEYINNNLGITGTWIETSYTASLRKNYAGVGMKYDQGRDAFISIQCHESAVLNEDTCRWVCDDSSHNFNVIKGEE
jgi:hypothetical protein